jgi:hypothetical protein
MTHLRSTTGAVAGGRRTAALAVLMLASGLLFATAWHRSASAGALAKEAEKVAREPSFDLPPIVVQVSQSGRSHPRTMVFKAALIFDETDEERINDSQRIAKTLMPRIMDSVITGVRAHQFDDASQTEDVNQVIMDRSVAVLQPYGVVIKALRIEYLGNR